jgi:drug/metabolite transporter (DMT)-like permease
MVPLLGTFVFGEQLSVRLIAGIAIVIVGLAIAFW